MVDIQFETCLRQAPERCIFCAARTQPASASTSYSSSGAAGDLQIQHSVQHGQPALAAVPRLRTAVPVFLDDILVGRRAADDLAIAVANLNHAMSKLFSHIHEDAEPSMAQDTYAPSDEEDDFSALN